MFKRKDLYKLFVIILVLSGCVALEYISDSGFKVSAQANSFEFPVKINNETCKDMQGKVGTCVLSTPSNVPIKVNIIPRPYSYTVAINCSRDLDFSKSFDVEKDKSFEFEIKDYKDLKFFQCKGEIFPDDRETEVSSQFWYFIKVVDSVYIRREEIYYDGDAYVVGKYAKYVTVCYKDGKCRNKKKLTYLKDKKKEVASIISESEVMRFNYYGI